MTIIVTGGAGFIGSALVRALVQDGERVVTIDKLTYAGSLENLASVRDCSEHRFIEADICHAARMSAIFAEHQPRAIIHLAAETHVDRSIDGPSAFMATNVIGTASLLEAALAYWARLTPDARDRFRFLHVSTDEVYGELGPHGYFDTTSAYRPNSPYAASKAAADHVVRAWHRTFGLPTIVSNCSNNYGPHQFPEKLIPLTILNALEGRKLPVYGRGQHVRDWLWVDDHVAALRAIVARGEIGGTYLVGGRAECRNIEIVQRICRILDEMRPERAPHDRLITFVADRPGHDARYAIDPRQIESELGWHPSLGLDEGLRATVAWYMANRDWCERVGNVYSRERLGRRSA
jgi:dTDP-glucose 4,6-dehydratase